MTAEPLATAHGDFGRTPFAHLLVYMADRALSGALFLREPEGVEHCVRFVKGLPVKVRPGDRHAMFGELLIEAGVVTEPVIREALETKGLLGDVLILTGHVDGRTLERIADEQFRRRMVRLFGLPAATKYRYYDEHSELEEWGGREASEGTLPIIMMGLRAHPAAGMSLAHLGKRLGTLPITLHADAASERFGFDAAEQSIASWLAQHQGTLTDLVVANIAPIEVVTRVLCALLITRHIDRGLKLPPLGADETAPSVAVARMPLRQQMHREGAAAPDPPGDGERATAGPRSPRRKRDAVSGVGLPDPRPPSLGDPITGDIEPISEVIEVEAPPGATTAVPTKAATGS